MSSPCTSLDLETAIVSYYNNPAVAKATGWVLEDMDPQDLIQGILHVDDSICMSKVFCTDCLFRGVQALWPKDVGVSLEAEGARIPFLHVELQVGTEREPSPVRAVPLSHNRGFARGEAAHPAFAKLSPYVGAPVSVQRHLAAYTWCRLAGFSQTLQGRTEYCVEPLGELLAEIAILGWPMVSIAAVLRRFPRTNGTDFAVLVRNLGIQLRTARPPQPGGPQAYSFFAQAIGQCLSHMWAQAGVAGLPAPIVC